MAEHVDENRGIVVRDEDEEILERSFPDSLRSPLADHVSATISLADLHAERISTASCSVHRHHLQPSLLSAIMDFSNFNAAEQAQMTKVIEKRQVPPPNCLRLDTSILTNS